MVLSISGITGVILISILFFLVVWVGYISVVLYKIQSHYNKLTHGVSKHGLHEILERILKTDTQTAETVELVRKRIEMMEYESTFHVQKIGVVRFNPFGDTGGEQSFALCFLDTHNNGLVISSLVSRAGVRWYTKQVVHGKTVDHALSLEEEEAVRKAKKLSAFHKKT